MGLFDTVIFPTPIACPKCGQPIESVQTKNFGSTLQEYHVGDVIDSSPVLNGVVREELYCQTCHVIHQPIYLALWHTLLVAATLDRVEAEQRMQGIDRAELIDYLFRHQCNALQWHNRFARLYGELQTYQDFLHADPPLNAEGASKDIRYYRIGSYVEEADPLLALIEGNKPTNPEDEEEMSAAP